MTKVHASAVKYKGRGVLILGPSGSGKSDLCLRLIDKGATLISDDYIDLSIKDDKLQASTPATIAGLLEVRGVGIRKFPHISRCELNIAVELVASIQDIERLPEQEFYEFEDTKLPKLKLYPFEPSAILKIELF